MYLLKMLNLVANGQINFLHSICLSISQYLASGEGLIACVICADQEASRPFGSVLCALGWFSFESCLNA